MCANPSHDPFKLRPADTIVGCALLEARLPHTFCPCFLRPPIHQVAPPLLDLLSRATRHGACRDDWLLPAISALLHARLPLKAWDLLASACGVDNTRDGGDWALCLACTTAAGDGTLRWWACLPLQTSGVLMAASLLLSQ